MVPGYFFPYFLKCFWIKLVLFFAVGILAQPETKKAARIIKMKVSFIVLFIRCSRGYHGVGEESSHFTGTKMACPGLKRLVIWLFDLKILSGSTP